MFQIGSTLREARLRQGFELGQVEAQLRIRSRYLAALEEERFDLLPGIAYARAFLRSYAEFLGLDSALLLNEYGARFEETGQLELLPAQVAPGRGRSPAWARLAAATLLVLLALAGLLVLGLVRGSHPHRGAAPSRPVSSPVKHAKTSAVAHARRPRPAARPVLRVPLRAIAAWDPYGDRSEHDADAPAATDGNPSTSWRTETYAAGLQKPGVGLLLDSGHPLRLSRLSLSTDTPGYTVVIEAGPSMTGPFRSISTARGVGASTSFPLRGAPERYYLVWITKLDHVAHVNEVRAFG